MQRRHFIVAHAVHCSGSRWVKDNPVLDSPTRTHIVHGRRSDENDDGHHAARYRESSMFNHSQPINQSTITLLLALLAITGCT